jgi:plasmid stabilization system protein ParE
LIPVRFTARAERDMNSIISYYEDITPGLSTRMVADIRDRLERVRHFPRIGESLGWAGIHRVLSSRYRFKIAYRVTDEAIQVVGIFRYQNREI